MKLTIGMPHYDDYRGVYMTVQALKMYQDLTDVEVLVVDNSPEKTNAAMACKALLEHLRGDFDTKYIPLHEFRGPAHAKNEVIRQARGEVVLVMDCHVMLEKDAIKRLKEYPIDDSFYTGPLLMDDCKSTCTHFEMMWRGGMWGIWAQAWQHPDGTLFSVYVNEDKFLDFYDLSLSRNKLNLDLPVIQATQNWNAKLLSLGCKIIGNNPNDPPFRIPAQGCGLFAVRKESWLGFNDNFYGFGGEEGYIHAKYLQAGRPTYCLPFLRWNHYFRKPGEINYRVVMQDRIRNYVIGFKELGLDLTPIRHQFVPKDISETDWAKLVNNPASFLTTETSNAGQPPETIDSITKLYDWSKSQQSKEYPAEYLGFIRAYASKSENILDMSVSSMDTIALASGMPKKLFSFKKSKDRALTKVHELLNSEVILEADSPLNKQDIGIYELVFINPEFALYDHLTTYLMLANNASSRYIIVSGITPYQLRGSDGKEGFSYALREFCRSNQEWFVSAHLPHGRGLILLSKNPIDKPSEEIRIWPMDNGPGHFLKQNLKKYLGIESTPNCSCNKRALMMDIQGPKWCRENIPMIVGWLKEEYERRKSSQEKTDKLGMVASMLPFSETAATILVKTSIRQSEKCQSKK